MEEFEWPNDPRSSVYWDILPQVGSPWGHCKLLLEEGKGQTVIHKDSDGKIQNQGQVHPTGWGPGGANGQAPAGLANPKEKHGSITQQTHPLQEESSGTGELWIGWQAKAGSLALQFPADESGN